MEDEQGSGFKLYDNTYKSILFERFLNERIALVEENRFPLMLLPDPPGRFVMHLVSDKFQEIGFDIQNLAQLENYCPPIGFTEGTIIHEFNFDGMLYFSVRHEKRRL